MEGNSSDFIYFLEIVKERSSASPGAHGVLSRLWNLCSKHRDMDSGMRVGEAPS